MEGDLKMFRLLKCEFKKFRGTYINSLSFIGMLFPVILVTLMFAVKRGDWIKSGSYNWGNFNQQLTMFFIFLVGPIITSFIAVFSVFYEYQEKTIKNVVASPNSRTSIIMTKMIYVSAYVVMQYAVVAIINILCAAVLGFDITMPKIIEYSLRLILAGLTTVMIIPLMMFITLMFKNFIPALVITVAGTISNIFALSWDKSYLSPWAIPPDIALSATTRGTGINIMYPIISMGIYIALFMICVIVYFNVSDQNT
jgi:bacitracin transport system permease protein